MDDALWAELGELAAQAGTDRSAVLRELARGWVKRQRRRLERDQVMRQELRSITRAP